MLHPLLLSVRHLREVTLARATEKQSPPIDAPKKLMELVPQFTRTNLDDRQVALLWGEMQLLLIESEGKPEDATIWAQLRNAADAALVGLLKRKEWAGLEEVFRREIFPRLANAVTGTRSARMQACIEATSHLRSLANRAIGEPQRWLLLQIAAMEYPRFGTSGWRARMGADFTWERATAVAQAIVDYVKGSGLANLPLTIGYDSRINADKVALLVAEVAVANGLNVHLTSRETPSPALIYYTTEKLGVALNAGLINCTPSHNPVKDTNQRLYLGTEYHGIRYNMPYGGVAPSRATDAIGRRAMELLLAENFVPTDLPRGKVTFFDPLIDYTDALFGSFPASVKSSMQQFWGDDQAMIVIDEMHSASRGYLRRVCDQLGLHYTVIHGEKDPLLGELLYANPEPPYIAGLQQKVSELKEQYPRIIGLGFDTDSDRFGVVDEQGNYMMMNQMLPMLADYLLTDAYNGVPGRIIRNMVSTRLLDRVAEENFAKIIKPTDVDAIVPHATETGYKVVFGNPEEQSGFLTHVVPVGFKYIADVMMHDLLSAEAEGETDPKRLQQQFHNCLDNFIIAGEESNGMTSRGHTPDKDGLWGALLALQMCAVRGQILTETWQAFTNKYGQLVSVRRDVQAPEMAKKALVNCYLDRYAEMSTQGAFADELLAGFKPVYCGGKRDELVEAILQDKDGSNLYLAIRASGTEPINRIYIECPEPSQRAVLFQAVGEELERQILTEIRSAPDINGIAAILCSVEMPGAGAGLPATYNQAIREAAVKRIKETAGSMTFERAIYQVDSEFAEICPNKEGTLSSL